MLALRDNLVLSADALRSHKLRAVLTILGLTMGVATLITVMTLVQGANTYVEQKIANLGTAVFRIARTPFAVADFTVIAKALKNKRIEYDDMLAVRANCTECRYVGASASTALLTTYKNKELQDANLYGYTPNMVAIDTRTGWKTLPGLTLRASTTSRSCGRTATRRSLNASSEPSRRSSPFGTG